MPASTMTPITIGSRELKMNCGRICSRRGREKSGKEKQRISITKADGARWNSYLHLARKHGDRFEFLALLLLQLLPVRGEFVE